MSTDPLFVDVVPGPGQPSRRVAIQANSEFTADDSSRYRVTDALRQRGNSVVFKACRLTPDGGIDHACAIKMLRNLHPLNLDRFANEVRVLQLVDHAFICRFYAAGTLRVDGLPLPWIAIELGGSNLTTHVSSQGPLAVATLKHIVPQMCEALQHLHDCQFVHRDVKPDNFVWTQGGSTDIMMIDFGLAKRGDEDRQARPLAVFFSSPELIAYARDLSHPVDHRSDLFQLGKVIWFLATGKISAGIPSRRLDPTGGPLHSLVMDLLQDDPDERIRDALTVARRMRAL